MRTATIEHNLADYELEEVLEKALRGVRTSIERPNRRFRDPYMESLAQAATGPFAGQIEAMLAKIEKVLS